MSPTVAPDRSTSDQVLHLLHRLTEKATGHVPLDELLDFIFENFQDVLPYCRLGYALIDHERPRVIARWARSRHQTRLKPGYHAPLAGSSLAEILRSNKPRILNDLHEHLRKHPDSESTKLIVKEGMRSSLTCPLLVQDQAVGFLFFSSDKADCYSAVDVEVFEEVAGHLAWMIERSQMADHLRLATEEALSEKSHAAEVEHDYQDVQRQLTLAPELQSLIFPGSLPELKGFRLAAHYQASKVLGGGFFNAFAVGDGKCGIFLADCNGHGHQGVMLKTILHTILKTSEWTDASAAEILAEVYRQAIKCLPVDSFNSGAVGVLDFETGGVDWSSAEYPAPILVKFAGYTVDGRMESTSERTPSFMSDCLPLDAGDKVLFYSESLLRLQGTDGTAYGSERLNEALHRLAKCSGQEMLDRLCHELFQFVGGKSPEDDLVVVVIERRPDNFGSLTPFMASEFPWRTEWCYERAASPSF
jgi:serine phosphatase RsbU (regulator of sigma subunit)